MRLADLVNPYVDQHRSVVEADPMGLGLVRYLGGDLTRLAWDPETETVTSPETLVLVTVRVAPQLDGDLELLERGLHGAPTGTIVVACLEDRFDTLPIPRLTELCTRNAWRIEQITELPYTRVRTGLLLTVTGDPESAAHVSLHNALVVTDHDLRRTRELYAQTLRRPPDTVTIARPVAAADDAESAEVVRLSREIARLNRRVEQLRAQRDKSEQKRKAATDKLKRLRTSPTFRVGRSVVQAPRHPVRFLRLPVDLAREYRHRRRHPAPAAPPAPAAGTGPTAAAKPRAGGDPSSIRASDGSRPVVSSPRPTQATSLWRPPAPAGVARLRIATIAAGPLVSRLQTAADVVPVAAGGWAVETGRRLPVADVLLVDSSAGLAAGAWSGLGEPGEVERTRELVEALEEADLGGMPSVLLVAPGGPPPGLRELEQRFTVTLPRGLVRPDGWDPGVPLSQLTWPPRGDRRPEPLHVFDALAPGYGGAAEAWLAALRASDLHRWLVGARVTPAVLHDDVPSDQVRAAPIGALARHGVIVVPSADDAQVAISALAAGCHVLAREPIPGYGGFAALTVMEHPGRARALLEAGLAASSSDEVMKVARRLLDQGASHERMTHLAELLELPLTPSLRAGCGLTVAASIDGQRAGEEFARQISAQHRGAHDVVVVSDEPSDAAWLEELRAGTAPVAVVSRSGSRWSDVGARTRQHRVAVWRAGEDWDDTRLADLEVFALAGLDPAGSSATGGALTTRETLLAQPSPVADELAQMNGEHR